MPQEGMIGYEMRPALGFKVFLNNGGNLTITQTNIHNEEVMIVLTKDEAWGLGVAINHLADDCDSAEIEIYGEEDDGRVREVLERVPTQGGESRSTQSLESNAGDDT